jgi:hypothetical protein
VVLIEFTCISACTSNCVFISPMCMCATQAELSSGIEGVRNAGKRALQAQEQMVEQTAGVNSQLGAIKQRLAMDRISLEAAVNNAQDNMKDTVGRLNAVVGEIQELQQVNRALREELEAVQKNQVGAQVCALVFVFVFVYYLSYKWLCPFMLCLVPACLVCVHSFCSFFVVLKIVFLKRSN